MDYTIPPQQTEWIYGYGNAALFLRCTTSNIQQLIKRGAITRYDNEVGSNVARYKFLRVDLNNYLLRTQSRRAALARSLMQSVSPTFFDE